MYKVLINPIIQSKTSLINHTQTPYMWQWFHLNACSKLLVSKYSPSLHWHWNHITKCSMWWDYLGNYINWQFLIKLIPRIITVISWCKFRTSYQQCLSIVYNIPPLANFNHLNCKFRVYTAQESAPERFRECTPYKKWNAPTGKFWTQNLLWLTLLTQFELEGLTELCKWNLIIGWI
jgi:hypothetical protein